MKREIRELRENRVRLEIQARTDPTDWTVIQESPVTTVSQAKTEPKDPKENRVPKETKVM